ncbi:hypothetical protein C0J52_12848 [Blattella germanica]|nr:hypothetical protein C0J52_12848 [Blattella germanica]
MSQAYACNYAPTSVLIYLAVLIYSPITAGFGVVGATVGTVAGVYLTEADTYAAAGGVYDGSWGFNGVLAGMCLGGLFFVISWSAAAITILCALFSSLLQYVFLPSFTRADLLVMTMPFNISALLFLCVTSRNLVRPRAISFPENQLREYRKHDHDEDSQDQLSSTSGNELDKDLEVEKKLAQTEVV